MAAPRTFEAAQTWLKSRVTLPTSLGSRELALAPDFPAAARMHAFFSARVTSANILERLREQVDLIAAGEVDYATARMRLKTFLGAQGIPADDVGMTPEPPPGVSEDDWRARREIVNLASTRRLDLVLRQNTAMAHAIGRRQVSEDPAVAERWPYYRYIARQDGNERPEHGALHNLVLRKDDPFWNTHTPPWDYNCRCDIEDADQEEADALGIGESTASGKVVNPGTGQFIDANQPNESGFVFDIKAAMSAKPEDYDWSAIQDSALRTRAEATAKALAESRIGLIPGVGNAVSLFNPYWDSQPRDELGQWGDAGGPGGLTAQIAGAGAGAFKGTREGFASAASPATAELHASPGSVRKTEWTLTSGKKAGVTVALKTRKALDMQGNKTDKDETDIETQGWVEGHGAVGQGIDRRPATVNGVTYPARIGKLAIPAQHLSTIDRHIEELKQYPEYKAARAKDATKAKERADFAASRAAIRKAMMPGGSY
jgi:SPP1 gp7 family putative phage head morphogenesis protein